MEGTKTIPKEPDYKSMYFRLYGALADLSEQVESIKLQFEEHYIEQAETVPVPEYLQLIH